MCCITRCEISAKAEREAPFLQQMAEAAQAAAKKSPSRPTPPLFLCTDATPFLCPRPRPLFLVGHSFGARAAVHLMCRKDLNRPDAVSWVGRLHHAHGVSASSSCRCTDMQRCLAWLLEQLNRSKVGLHAGWTTSIAKCEDFRQKLPKSCKGIIALLG